MSFTKKHLLLVCVAVVAFGLSSCRELEQNRPLTEQKGIYEGPADTKLTQETVRDLRSRNAYQSF